MPAYAAVSFLRLKGPVFLTAHRCSLSSLASKGNFKDGVRYGKYGPVGSDKKTQEERVHTEKQFHQHRQDRYKVNMVYGTVVPVICGVMVFTNWYRASKGFKGDSVLD